MNLSSLEMSSRVSEMANTESDLDILEKVKVEQAEDVLNRPHSQKRNPYP